jgi:LPXTG-motif cell wall-anchored protein
MRTTGRRARRGLLALALFVLGATLVAPAGHTQEAGDGASWAVQPSGPDGPGTRDWFTYTLDPGEVFGDTVSISNLSDRPIRFFIYPTDAVSVSDTAGFAALKDTEEPVDVGTWIELAASEYTVEPGKRIDVPFSITVPDDAEPGDHAGAILAVDADEGAGTGEGRDGISFDVRHRLGARVYVRVGGEVSPALRIDELHVERDGDQATVAWEVSNTGNVRLNPTATVKVTGWLGRTVRTMPASELPELLPGANYVGASIVTGLPSWEPLRAHLVVEAEGVRTERSRQFAGYPWLLILGLLLIVGLGIVWWVRRRRRRRPSAAKPPKRERVAVPA